MFPRPIQQSLVSLGVALAVLAAASSPAGARPADPPTVDAHHAALLQHHHPVPAPPLSHSVSRHVPVTVTHEASSAGVDALPIVLCAAAALMLAGVGVTTVRLRRRRSIGASV
jgi:hypothetical protein